MFWHQSDKNMKHLVAIFLILFTTHGFAQQEKVDIQQLLSGSYVFKAQQALPTGGRMIPLTSEFDLRVSKDSVVAFLPYFGRAYSAGYNMHEGGVKFTSTQFEVKSKNRRKGGVELTITPKDNNDIQQMFLTVNPSGYASLQVVSLNRQPISYNGYVAKQEEAPASKTGASSCRVDIASRDLLPSPVCCKVPSTKC